MQKKMGVIKYHFNFNTFSKVKVRPLTFVISSAESNANENGRLSVSLCLTFSKVKVRPLTFVISFCRSSMQIRMGLFKYHFTLLFKVKVSPFTFGITFSQKPMQMKTGVFTVSITLPYCFKRKSQTPHFCDQFQSEANANEKVAFQCDFTLLFKVKVRPLTVWNPPK